MFLAVGAGYYGVALFHVVTHAFFKACLFLSAGSVIHGCHHEQDMSRMGGLAKKMPLTCLSYGLATLAIAGIAPFAGYFSKHAILDAVASNQNLQSCSSFISITATVVAICTAFYMMRSFILTFLGSYRGSEHPHEAPAAMTIPVLLLALLSVVGGWLLQHSLPQYLQAQIPRVLHHASSSGVIEYLLGSLPGIVGVAVAVLLFIIAPSARDAIRRVTWPAEKLFSGKYFVDELYSRVIISPVRLLSNLTSRVVNQTFVEGSGSALGGVTRAVGELTCRLTTGQVATYVLIMFAAVAVLFSLFVQAR
jgi:NADH-quinone oxidoreductase subunit L